MIATRRHAKRADKDRALHFKIGDIRLCVQSKLPHVLDDFAELYRDYRQKGAAEHGAIHTQVKHGRWSAPGRRRYDICVNGEVFRSNLRPVEV